MNLHASSNPPIRILHVIPRLGPGGAERVLCTMIRESSRLGVTAHLCVLGDENAFPERLRDLVQPHFLGYRGSRRDIAGMWRCQRQLRQLAQRLEVDLVHAHLWPAAQMAGLALRGTRLPLLVHVHDTRDWIAGRRWRDRAVRWWTRCALSRSNARFVAVSHAAGRYTTDHLRWIESPMPVIHNGYDSAVFATHAAPAAPATTTDPAHPIVVGVAGRLAPEKGQPHIIEAVAALRDRNVNVQLNIAGEGGTRSELERLIARLNLADRVQLLGRVEQMADFYRSLDVFALPSVGAEGLPMVILEAMTHRLPIVATDVAGASEAVRHGEEGLLVPPGDAAALADAIQQLAENDAFRLRLAAAAQQRVSEQFTGEQMAQQLVATYREILDLPQPADDSTTAAPHSPATPSSPIATGK